MIEVNLLHYLHSISSNWIYSISNRVINNSLESDQYYIHTDSTFVYKILYLLSTHYNVKSIFFVDLFCVDYPHCKNRFLLGYNVYSIFYKIRYILSFNVDTSMSILSMVRIYPSIDWFEREVFDMFGILFMGHPDLRRILTDYGFSGNPLRKDFPLTGFFEVFYNFEYKCIVYHNATLIQDFRFWSFEPLTSISNS